MFLDTDPAGKRRRPEPEGVQPGGRGSAAARARRVPRQQRAAPPRPGGHAPRARSQGRYHTRQPLKVSADTEFCLIPLLEFPVNQEGR